MNDEYWSTENIQNEIKEIENVLLERNNIEKINSFFSQRGIFSKLTLTECLYYQIDCLLLSFKTSENKINLTITIICLLILLMIIKDQKSENINNLDEKVKNKIKFIVNAVLEKNRKYGNSALNPLRIIASADKMEQLYVRLDDKLNRVINRQNDEDQDLPFDIAGYFILIYVCLKSQSKN